MAVVFPLTTCKLLPMPVVQPLQRLSLRPRPPRLLAKCAQHRVPSAWPKNWVLILPQLLVRAGVVVFPRKMLKQRVLVVVPLMLVPTALRPLQLRRLRLQHKLFLVIMP